MKPVNLALLLLQIAVILAACRLLRSVLGWLGQPPVMGEIVAGLPVGPSLFGWIAPTGYAWLVTTLMTVPILHFILPAKLKH